MAFEVIGRDDDDYDEDDVEGADVLGYSGPMGDEDDDEGSEVVVGYDDDGGPIIVGRRRPRRRRHRRHRGHRRRHLVSVARPRWRGSQLAPGVIAPDQGLLSLPLAGSPSNQFSSTVTNIVFTGQLQKPFRGERLFVSTVRTGTTAVGLVLGQLFVGTDLQQLDVSRFDVEQLGATTAFGARLAMKPAQPGVIIRLDCILSSALTSPDTIDVSVQLLGRLIH